MQSSCFYYTVNSAALLGNQVYGPYGTQRYSKGTIGTNKGFTGQYSDPLTGLDYYNARYYDPVVGVFLSADTVQGNAKGMNPYAYVGGNPETWSDPTGHEAPCLENGCGEGASTGMPPDTGGGPSGSDIVTGILAFFIGVAIVFHGGYNSGPQNSNPQATPTPTETPTSGATPSTDTNGAMCKAGGCDYGWSKDDQLTIAENIDRAAQRQRTSGSNGGGGQLKILDSAGNVLFDNPVIRIGEQGKTHTEQLTINWAIEMIERLLSRGVPLAGATINLLVFSQTEVCPTCQGKLNTSTWLNKLYQATGLSKDQVTVNLYVWQWNPNPGSTSKYQQVYASSSSDGGPQVGKPF